MENAKFNYPLPDLSKLTSEELASNSPLMEYIDNQLLSLLTQKTNLHGRRVGKAKDAISPGDYVTKRQLNGTLVGTLAQRPSANLTPGTTYFATDRNVTYIAYGGHWHYYSGIQVGLLAAKPAPSVLYDFGYRYYATDYNWEYYWNLTGWVRTGGTSLFVQGFQVAPTQNGWGLCDGSTYTYSKDDGTTGSVTTDNLTGTARFVKFGSSHTTAAAVAPTISGGDLTGDAAITGTTFLSGSALLPRHAHGTSILVDNTIVTDTEDQPHRHGSDGGVANIVIDFNTFNYASGGNQAIASFNGNGLAGHTDNNDVPHNHPVTVDFSGLSTDETDGSEEIDLSGISLDTSGLSVDTSGLSVETITAGTDGTPIAVQYIPYIRL